MDHLPVEIIHLIVERAQECPALPGAGDWSARSTTLRSLALVARRWTGPAQHWINVDVWLRSEAQACAFLEWKPMRLDIIRSLRVECVKQLQLYRLLDGATALGSLQISQGSSTTFAFEQALGRPSLSKLSALVLETPVSFNGSALPFALRVLDLSGCCKITIPRTISHLKLASDSLHILSLPLFFLQPSSHSRKVLLRSTLPGSAFSLRVLRGLDTQDLKIKQVPLALKACHKVSSLDFTTSATGSSAIKEIATALCLFPNNIRDLSLSFDRSWIPFASLDDLVHHLARKRVRTLAITGDDTLPVEDRERGWEEYDPEQSFRNQLPNVEMDLGY